MSSTTSTRPPVLILGRGVTALGVQRSLARAGIPYFTVETGDDLLRMSRWFRRPPAPPPAAEADLADWLEHCGLDRAVLLPCSDRWVQAVAELPAELGERFPSSVPPADTVRMLVDKAEFAAALTRAGTPHPWTRPVGGVADLDEIPDDRLVNAFLKPRHSQRFMEVFLRKAMRVRDRQDAREKLARISAEDIDVVVQEYVPGPATNHYFIDGFIDRHGEPRAVFARQRLRMWPPDFGNSSLMETVAPDSVQPAVDSVLALLASVGHRGIFSSEFKLDPRDGVFRILEVNTRAWWYVEFATQCGVDVCAQAYEDALERPVSTIDGYEPGLRCVFPYYDFSAATAQWRAGNLSLLEWARSWVGARQPVFQWADPWPGLRRGSGTVLWRLTKPFRSRGS